MSAYYFDSSGIVKRYIAETGSLWVGQVTEPASGNPILTSIITGAEVVAAICKRERGGSITSDEMHLVLTAFEVDFRSQLLVGEISHQIVDKAMILAEQYGLRGYDSVQLATALMLQQERIVLALPSLIFVSADDKLNAAAQAEGLQVENPAHHT